MIRSLTPFVDRLPIPPRRVIAEPIRFNVRLQAAMVAAAVLVDAAAA